MSTRCNRSSAGRSRGPANFRYWAGSQAMLDDVSGEIEGGNAGPETPAMRLDAGPLQRVAELPAYQAAPGQPGAGPGVETGPGHKRAAPAIGPDLDALRPADTGPARMEAEGVGDDEGIGRHRENSRLGQAQPRQLAGIDAERALPIFGIRRAGGGKAHPPLPGEALRRQAVRARNIGERPRIRGHIGQKQPSLDRRVEGIG